MSKITVKDGTEIYYKDWGTGQPIFFHHGWPLSSDDWDAQMMFFLGEGYRVVASDRRGHGRSSQVWDGHDMDHYADDVAAVVRHLGIQGAIHVGHSTGGGVVAHYIARHPEDPVAKGVLIILAIMSMGSWYILAVKMLEQRKVSGFGREASEKFWTAGTVGQGTDALHKDSPYQFIAASGLEATKKHGGLMGHIPLNDWISMSIQRSVDRVNREMQSGLSFLATVGSISPFVGLFGTV